jgi:2-polyprenyl-3-methyl-5-hydroxy-6-metoxy-1,4-benzoquinol methylase
MFEEIESAWTADSAGYDDAVKKQLKNKRDLQHWSKELQLILGAKPLHVLDVGCGPGFFSIMLGRLGHHVKAIDGSIGMVEHARANFQAEGCSAKAEVEDAVTLPDEENESYIAVEDEAVLEAVYAIFKERYQDILTFAE